MSLSLDKIVMKQLVHQMWVFLLLRSGNRGRFPSSETLTLIAEMWSCRLMMTVIMTGGRKRVGKSRPGHRTCHGWLLYGLSGSVSLFSFPPLKPIRNSVSCKLLVLLYPQVCVSLGLSNSSHLLHYWSSPLLLGCILRLVYKLVTCAANAVVGGGAWVGSTLFQLLLLRRQANDSQTVEEIYLSPIQVCALTESNTRS